LALQLSTSRGVLHYAALALAYSGDDAQAKAFLASRPGLECGLMMAQVTAEKRAAFLNRPCVYREEIFSSGERKMCRRRSLAVTMKPTGVFWAIVIVPLMFQQNSNPRAIAEAFSAAESSRIFPCICWDIRVSALEGVIHRIFSALFNCHEVLLYFESASGSFHGVPQHADGNAVASSSQGN
jgi:hypothetical protein